VFYQQSQSIAPTGRLDGDHTSFVNPGVVWTKTDGGIHWIGNAVAIGNFDTEVFAEWEFVAGWSQLFSSYDSNPPTALFTDSADHGSENHHVAMAYSTATRATFHSYGTFIPPAFVPTFARLSKFSDTSSTPDWTYTFPFAPDGWGEAAEGMGLGISRDGQTIVVADSNRLTSTVDVAVFSSTSNVPLSYTTIQLGGFNNQIRGFHLSADGSTVLLTSSLTPVNVYVFDVASHSVVFSTPLHKSFDSHAISGDGSVFAFGKFNEMRVYEKVGGVYTNTFVRTVPGYNYCSRIAISDDSNAIAYSFDFYDTWLTVQIEALDLQTQTITMTDVVTATGTLQNVASCMAFSADGEHFAVGLWGDGSGPVAEARLYARDQNAPFGTINLPGSVNGIAISADGTRMVSGSKAGHANNGPTGGAINLFSVATPFTGFCFGHGSLPMPCPCLNFGFIGRGCQNSAGTNGAELIAGGTTVPDTVLLRALGELPTSLTVFMQGQATLGHGAFFGDGVRSIDSHLLRVGVHNAVNGMAVYPQAGDASITTKSALHGDPIAAGMTRYYQAYYRDPSVTFCTGKGFNVSNAVRIDW
jgi:hypothetical protein